LPSEIQNEIEILKKKQRAERSTDVRKHQQYQGAMIARLNNNYLSTTAEGNTTLT
jgi:hypothetical protein